MTSTIYESLINPQKTAPIIQISITGAVIVFRFVKIISSGSTIRDYPSQYP